MMKRLIFLSAALLVSVVAVLAAPKWGAVHAAQDRAGGGEMQSAPRSMLLRILDQRFDAKPLRDPGNMPLKEAISILHDLVKATGKELPILVDAEAFKEENPDAFTDPGVLYDTKIQFPPFPREMTVAAALSFMLGKIETRNATYVVMPDHILVTTFTRISPECKLGEKVRGFFETRPLISVLRELSETVGVTIVIDNRAAERAKTTVSATFLNDLDLAGALRVLTEMADLKVLALDGVVFVTTPAHAEALRKEHIQKLMELEKLRVLREKSGYQPGPGFPVGGFGGSGLPGFVVASEPLMDPLWPYLPGNDGRKKVEEP
jgi:hypothetical protein